MTELLRLFAPISLEEMSGIRLMNRTDTKFVTSVEKLKKLLELAQDEYFAQEIAGQRIARYYTMYYDTPDNAMYFCHHSGRIPRQKLRVRSYVDSHLNFLEVKSKNNHGRTKKKRIGIPDFNPQQPDERLIHEPKECCPFIARHLGLADELLHEKIENRFERITLVNRRKTERLTIDINLRFHNLETGYETVLPGVAIIELKRDGMQHSPIIDLLKMLRIHPMGFSKYCMGMALTNPDIKQNRFKERLHKIEKINIQAIVRQKHALTTAQKMQNA